MSRKLSWAWVAAGVALLGGLLWAKNAAPPQGYAAAVEEASVHLRELGSATGRIYVYGKAAGLPEKTGRKMELFGGIRQESDVALAEGLRAGRPQLVVDATAFEDCALEKLGSLRSVLDSLYTLETRIYYDARLTQRQVAFKIYRLGKAEPRKINSVYAGGWRFEDGGTDDSPARIRARVFGAKTVQGRIGQGLFFDGKDDYADLGWRIDDFSNGFTVALWTRPEAMPHNARFFEMGNGIDRDAFYLSAMELPGYLRLEGFINGMLGGKIEVASGISMNRWQHFAVVFLPSNEAIIYKDGGVLGRWPMALPRPVPRRFNFLGKSKWRSGMFRGTIDEFHVFHRALSEMEIRDLMEGRVPR